MLDAPPRLDSICRNLLAGHSLDERIDLAMGDCRIQIRSNSGILVDQLRDYFGHCLTGEAMPDISVVAIEMTPPHLNLDFWDWKRDPGKLGRKDAVADIPGGRVVRKVRTDMQFLMGETHRLAVGPCLSNPNQIINFTISQYLSWLLRRGWLLCHAAGVAADGKGLAIAGMSGGGKSTLALNLISQGLNFVSNDRLLVRLDGSAAHMAGVPKLPRVNPGTLLHNADLTSILSAERAHELSDLAPDKLRTLEEKYDVDISRFYGPGRIEAGASLEAFVILNWNHGDGSTTQIRQVDLAKRPDLLAAVMKPPGPFHKTPQGWSTQNFGDLAPEPYLAHLSKTPIYEVCGGANFNRAATVCLELLSGGQCQGKPT